MTTTQLNLFTEQNLEREPNNTTKILPVQNNIRFKPSPIDLDDLKYIADSDVISDAVRTDIDEAHYDCFEKYWQNYKEFNSEVNELLYDQLANKFFTTFVRVFEPMKEVVESNIRLILSPREYVTQIYNVYAREETIQHTLPIPYYQWMDCFKGWISRNTDRIYNEIYC